MSFKDILQNTWVQIIGLFFGIVILFSFTVFLWASVIENAGGGRKMIVDLGREIKSIADEIKEEQAHDHR